MACGSTDSEELDMVDCDCVTDIQVERTGHESSLRCQLSTAMYQSGSREVKQKALAPM